MINFFNIFQSIATRLSFLSMKQFLFSVNFLMTISDD